METDGIGNGPLKASSSEVAAAREPFDITVRRRLGAEEKCSGLTITCGPRVATNLWRAMSSRDLEKSGRHYSKCARPAFPPSKRHRLLYRKFDSTTSGDFNTAAAATTSVSKRQCRPIFELCSRRLRAYIFQFNGFCTSYVKGAKVRHRMTCIRALNFAKARCCVLCSLFKKY